MKNIFLCIMFMIFFQKSIYSENYVKVINNPIMEEHLSILRDPKTSLKNFRSSLKISGEIMGYEISEELNKKTKIIKTVLDKNAYHNVVKDKIVLIAIIRAGIPFLDGFLKIFQNAEVGFLAIKRDEHTLKSKIYYEALPDLKDKIIILMDPMFATGGSAENALKNIFTQNSKPNKIFFVSLFSTKEGIDKIKNLYPDVLMYTGVIDPVLNDVGYIVPGLGDAGDRAYGIKIR